ncbi:MAG TPA: metallophosphoesterase, partial [Aggregatilineales bacterium]|nr:metallophosphoesterase [Aggregatilineales bacterium]HQA70044.1 metallophosphoesterase [Aggregatilineales bacterium]
PSFTWPPSVGVDGRRLFVTTGSVMNRAVDLLHGLVYTISDLHGEWEPYARYRDHFLTLLQEGLADHFVILGDMIHGYGLPEDDYSLDILLDLIQLRNELGGETIIPLLGNHELMHIYSTPYSKGNVSFLPRFEHMLGDYRGVVIDFLHSLPFVVRTAAGVMLTHAGASTLTATPQAAEWLLSLSHEAVLREVDRLLSRSDVLELLASYGQITGKEYEQLAREQLAVTGPDDPRYYDLLRGFIATNLEPEWDLLEEFFFTQAERRFGSATYSRLVEQFLDAFSPPGMPQRVLVAGHIAVSGGYDILANRQIRLASWAHAHPKSEACYLIFDAAEPVNAAADLEPNIYPIP